MSNFILWCYENANTVVQLELQGPLSIRKQAYDLDLSHLALLNNPVEKETQFKKNQNKYLADQKKLIKEWILDVQITAQPMNFDLITADLFTTYILSLRKTNGTKPGMSTYTTHRASIKHLFRMYSVSLPTELSELLALDYKSLKRTVAERINASGGEITVGKIPLEYSFYCFFTDMCLKNSTKEDVFGNCF